MNYTIHQLQIFIKVAETKSVTKASEMLFMTQPAVSIQLKKFQDQFPIPLFEVISRQLYITEFGYEIADLAKNILQQLEEINYKTQSFKGLLTGKLNISSASTGKYVLPYFLSGFITEHKEVELVLDVTNKARVIESLQNNEIEFALVSTLPDQLQVHEERLIQNKLYYISSDEKRSKKSRQLIYREQGSATRAAMETYFKDGKGERKQMELTSNEAVKQAVLAGLGDSIMPLIGVHSELEFGQLFIQERKGLPITTEWRLIWLKDKKLSPVADAFLKYVRQHKEEIKHRYFDWYFTY